MRRRAVPAVDVGGPLFLGVVESQHLPLLASVLDASVARLDFDARALDVQGQ